MQTRPVPLIDTVRVVIYCKDTSGHVVGVESDHYAGAVFFPGGGVDAGETHVQAAVREVFEETGLTVAPEHLEWIDERVTHGRDRKAYRTVTFLAQTYAGTLRGSVEGDVVRRLPWDLVAGSPFPEYYREIAEYLEGITRRLP